MNGIYVIYYTGVAGVGQAMFTLMNGVVTGSDENGGTLDGTLMPDENGMLEMDINLGVLPDGVLVTGFMNDSDEMVTHHIGASLPKDFANEQPIMIKTPTGPVNAIFRRLREI